jgi:ribosomal protein S18 acetylase RimI-like enzyme
MGAVELAEADVPRAAGLIARAFDEDPLLVHMLPDPQERERLGPVHVAPVLRMCTRHGSTWRTESFDAVAAWMPPDAWPPDPVMTEECGYEEAAAVIGPEALARFRDVYGIVDHAHDRVVPEPHWVLYLVGTEPGRQRRGAASTVLAPVLERATAEATPCYLETFIERNLAFYARHGFEVAAEARHDATGIRAWGMLRR